MKPEIVAAVVAVLACPAFGAASGRPMVTVRVIGYARVTGTVLKDASAEAQRVFHRANIETAWVACSVAGGGQACRAPIENTDLIVRVVRQKDGGAHLGTALLEDTEGRYATIYYDSVEAAAARGDCGLSLWLAHVMAHEVGHLLGLNHAATGIMSPVLSQVTMRLAVVGKLVFQPGEGERMLMALEPYQAEGARGTRYKARHIKCPKFSH